MTIIPVECLVLKRPLILTVDFEVLVVLEVQNNTHCENVLIREYFNSVTMILEVSEHFLTPF